MATYQLWIDDEFAEQLREALDDVGQYGGRIETVWHAGPDVLPVMVRPRSMSVGVPMADVLSPPSLEDTNDPELDSPGHEPGAMVRGRMPKQTAIDRLRMAIEQGSLVYPPTSLNHTMWEQIVRDFPGPGIPPRERIERTIADIEAELNPRHDNLVPTSSVLSMLHNLLNDESWKGQQQ